MNRSSIAVVAAGIGGVLLLVLAGVYFALPAHSLPAFIPGHVSATDAEAAHHHVKHGVAALAVGLAAFAFAWMNTGPAAKARREQALTQ